MKIAFAATLLAAAGMTATPAAAQTPAEAAANAKPRACAQMTTQELGLPDVAITSAIAAPAGKGLPAACVIRGAANARSGADGRTYAIGFEMRLPANWNGRFLHQVNGASDGVVIAALGDPGALNAYAGAPALARGFAVLSSDEGHDGANPALAGFALAAGAAFGLDPQARRDYGYAGDAAAGPIGKAIIAKFYRQAPARSYMAGCSNGGRHAMVAASRMGEAYDGFIAGDPGFDMPRAALQFAWDAQSFAAVDPDIRKSFSRADMALVARKLLEACDGLDGLVDGMASDIKACQSAFHLTDLTCSGDKSVQCLSKRQVDALARSFKGPQNGKGEPLYVDWPFDGGIGAENWRRWKISTEIAAWNDYPISAIWGAASLAMIFSTPPVVVKGEADALMNSLMHFDFDRDAPKIYDKLNGESAWDVMAPPDADDPKLTALQAAGHKLILYHGQSDGAFSFNATANWMARLAANHGGEAGDFARLFAVPGMGHCSDGPATDQFDMLSAIVEWAERGKAPDAILARLSPGNRETPSDWSPDRTRLLCPWPKAPRYSGGDKEKAESFACR